VLAAGRNRRGAGFVVIVMIASVWISGKFHASAVHKVSAATPIARIGLVQGNIEAALKWELGPEYSLDKYVPASYRAVEDGADLIVWPETAAPVYIQQSSRWRSYFKEFVDSLGVPVITGGRYLRFDEGKRIPFNPAFMISPGGVPPIRRYEKVFLVPFGERVPGQKLIPALGNLNLGQAEFKPGDSVAVWRYRSSYGHEVSVAPNICFESIFPQHLVESVSRGADVQLNLTNDGWYVGTGGPWQHLELSRISAVETGRSIVRATNTGISAIIAPSGQYLKTLPENVRGAIVADIPAPVDTPFLHHGWKIRPAIPYMLLFLVIAAALIPLNRLKNKSSESE
jgi:apolipoprotein N-acyltransferase